MPSSDFVDDPYVNEFEDEDEIVDIYNEPLEYHEWVTWYSNDLMNMWMGMKAYLQDSYLEGPMLGAMTLDDFSSFIYSFSSAKSSRRAT